LNQLFVYYIVIIIIIITVFSINKIKSHVSFCAFIKIAETKFFTVYFIIVIKRREIERERKKYKEKTMRRKIVHFQQ
jgi:hypothetical protein